LRMGSSASNGMTAEESQNFIADRASSAFVPVGSQCRRQGRFSRQA
jgi:hypothetical protein